MRWGERRGGHEEGGWKRTIRGDMTSCVLPSPSCPQSPAPRGRREGQGGGQIEVCLRQQSTILAGFDECAACQFSILPTSPSISLMSLLLSAPLTPAPCSALMHPLSLLLSLSVSFHHPPHPDTPCLPETSTDAILDFYSLPIAPLFFHPVSLHPSLSLLCPSPLLPCIPRHSHRIPSQTSRTSLSRPFLPSPPRCLPPSSVAHPYSEPLHSR